MLDLLAVGLPAVIVVDNGPEFAGRVLDAWAYRHGVTVRFIRPGHPVENAYIESFNGTLRDKCLNEHWFVRMAGGPDRDRSVARRLQHGRPHSALDNLTPEAFARLSAGAQRLTPPRPQQGKNPDGLTLSV